MSSIYNQVAVADHSGMVEMAINSNLLYKLKILTLVIPLQIFNKYFNALQLPIKTC